MTTRSRLLAILKEPDRYVVADLHDPFWEILDNQELASVSTSRSLTDINAKCADLNASHRLKRLCEEMEKIIRADLEVADPDWMRERLDRLSRSILALGEPNEHS